MHLFFRFHWCKGFFQKHYLHKELLQAVTKEQSQKSSHKRAVKKEQLMSTIVLVHGAWSGAHGFRKLRPLLRASGFDVYTPSLTGIGERSHLTGPAVNLTTHVYDVVNTVLYEDLSNITLLGFSYGGMVVSGAMQHIGERVKHLVYLDAFVPSHGDSANSLRGSVNSDPIRIGHEWTMMPASRHMDDEADAAWFGPRRSPQPAATFAEAVSLPAPVEEYPCSLSYIKATADESETDNSAFWRAARMAQQSPRWGYHEIATNHMVAINRPRELADLLTGISKT
jgi:pimeloyl-ACP methyl ester carboxylesterase